MSEIDNVLDDFHFVVMEKNELKQRIARLEYALIGLLDVIDSKYDERCGLTYKQWKERIKDAKQALARVGKSNG